MAVVGPILGAFGKTKVTQQNYSDAVRDAITGAAKNVEADRAANAADLAAYTQGINRAVGRIEALNPEDTATLGRLIGETAAADPMSVYRGVGDYQMGLFNQFAKGLADQGRRGQNLQFARMGYGGRGGGTYTQNALMDRISQNLAPTFAGVLGNLGRDTQVLGNQRLAQGGQVANLINARRGFQSQGAELALNPALARAELADLEAGRIGTLGSAARTNTAGFRAEKDTLGKFAEGLSEAEDTILDTAMGVLSMYTGGMGGGMGGIGGMMGGGGGGGGGGGSSKGRGAAAATPTFMPNYAPPVDFGSSGNYYNPGSFGYSMGGGARYSAPVQDIIGGGGYGAGIGVGYGYRPGV